MIKNETYGFMIHILDYRRIRIIEFSLPTCFMYTYTGKFRTIYDNKKKTFYRKTINIFSWFRMYGLETTSAKIS